MGNSRSLLSKSIFSLALLLPLQSWAQSETVTPFNQSMDIKELRISGDPTAATGVVGLYESSYSAYSYLSAPPTWTLDSDIEKTMLAKALSGVITRRGLTVTGEKTCLAQPSICWRVADAVNY